MSRDPVLALALATCLAAQDPSFKAGISIVEIDAQVFDKNGIIDGLTQVDFAVQDNRQPVTLRYCVEEETPLDLVLLLELSKMMAPNRMKLRGAAGWRLRRCVMAIERASYRSTKAFRSSWR
jgi:hypothetical protein